MIGATVYLRGTVAGSDAPAATLTGFVEPAGGFVEPGFVEPGFFAGGAQLPTLVGTVSRDVVESVDGPSIHYGWKVKLAGEWIPEEDLVGPLELEESIDAVPRTASFGLAGHSYSILRTIRTWTRTPVEIWTGSGRPDNFREELRLKGYVVTADQADGHEPVLRIRCGDQAVLFDRHETCDEVPPDAGLRRDEILASVLAGAGITQVDLVPGAPYNRPLFTGNTPLFSFAAAWGEPEGWAYEFRTDDTFASYVPRLKLPPEAPDHVWTLDDILELEPAPPRDVASRWIIRATGAVFVDEHGLEVEVTRTELKALKLIERAVQRQNADGSISELFPPAEGEQLRTVQIVEDQRSRRGGLDVFQVTREWGWYNPPAAKLRSGGDSDGPVGGYYFAIAYITGGGAFVAWPLEAFVQTGERRRTPVHDVNGTLHTATADTFAWYRKTMAVKETDSATFNVVNAGVADDDESYFPFQQAGAFLTLEEFGLKQRDVDTFTYGPQGAVVTETQKSFGWVSPRTPVSGNPWYVLASGAGQKELVAGWRQFSERQVTDLLTKDGRLAGTTQAVYTYTSPHQVAGSYDYGDYHSNYDQQRFGLTQTEIKQFNQLSESAYEEVTYSSDQPRLARIIPGRLPMPRYKGSVWTRLVQQPIELVVDDPVLEDWFGFRRQVFTSEYVQSLDEASALLQRKRRRELAFKHAVRRLRTNARRGDTVLVIDPRHGIADRCLIAKVHETWDLAPRTAVIGRYDLEQPL
ncbi:MAG TPA: hypothetical protein VNJ70_17880 [Thermoanaerobaculia bacterium]|nr:hypothetical protein [Thermoanaerobaculia bacterium]